MGPDHGKDKMDDRTAAWLALALGEEGPPGPCPPPESLAALIDGRVDAAERERLLEHLDRCPDCFALWLSAANAAPSAETAGNSRKRPLMFGGLVAAAACALLILLLPLNRADRPLSPLDTAYTAMRTRAAEAPPASLPWERARRSYGFAQAKVNHWQNLAFGAGLWAGRAALHGADASPLLPEYLRAPGAPEEDSGAGLPAAAAWEETDWSAWYTLGKWCYLMGHAGRSPGALPDGFLENQGRALAGILSEIPPPAEDNDLRRIHARLSALRRRLPGEATGAEGTGAMKGIASQTEIVVHLLSPAMPLPDAGEGAVEH